MESDAPATVRYYKRGFWDTENLKFSRPHYRLEKLARLINRLCGADERTLLDLGCGPATLRHLLSPAIRYHGIDIAIHDPAPYLREADLLEGPISFDGRQFDIIVAQGLFEYLGDYQSQKFGEIARLLRPGGSFIATYMNFDHRRPNIYGPYSNVRPFEEFRSNLTEFFKVNRAFPSSYNWNHHHPNRTLVKAINMVVNVNIPIIGRALAVDYVLLCSARDPTRLG